MKKNSYCVCPLYPFHSNCTNILLDFGIHITPDTGIYKDTFEGFGPPSPSIWEPPQMSPLWIAQIPYPNTEPNLISTHSLSTTEWPPYIEDLQFDRLTFCFVTALRLLKAGLVTPGPIVYFYPDGNTALVSPDWLPQSEREIMFGKPVKYILRRSEISLVNSLLHDALSWYDRHAGKDRLTMDVAIKRFHSAYHGEPSQKIIDQMIAFEALFLGDDKELSYKLALRSAYLLGRTAKIRTSIFNDMKKAYAFRNAIVHGRYKFDESLLKKTIPITESYLRHSIRFFLSILAQGATFSSIQKQLLDGIILHGSRAKLPY